MERLRRRDLKLKDKEVIWKKEEEERKAEESS
jgi:hypothetical protein